MPIGFGRIGECGEDAVQRHFPVAARMHLRDLTVLARKLAHPEQHPQVLAFLDAQQARLILGADLDHLALRATICVRRRADDGANRFDLYGQHDIIFLMRYLYTRPSRPPQRPERYL